MPVKIRPRPVPGPTPLDPPPVTPPQPDDIWIVGRPEGTIPTTLAIAYGSGGPWSKVTRHAEFHEKYGKKYGVPPSMLMAMEVIESGGESIPNGNGYPNWGVMQLTHSWNGGPRTKWEAVGEKLSVVFKEPEGQIAIAAYVLGGHDGDSGTPEQIFLKHYYPIPGGLDAVGPDGHTQRQYLADMRVLMDIIAAAKKVIPPPHPIDMVSIIVGGRPTNTDYGWKAPTNLPYYEYFNGHGGNEHQHPGIDATGAKGQTLYSPIKGKVVCAGTGKGPGAWGTGCAAFGDVMANGAGRIEILAEDGKHSLILGHCSDSLVDVGDTVELEDPVARMGGYNGIHVHIERRRHVGGSAVYTIEDPLLFNQPGAVTPGPRSELPPFTWLESPNRMSRNGVRPVALVYHVADSDSLEGTLSWLRQRGSNASSHWVIARDGKAYQLVGSAYAAFTNGAVLNPRRDIPWLAGHADNFLSGRENANWYCITIEHMGKPSQAFTKEQIATSIAISKYYLDAYPSIGRHRGGMMRHSDFASVQNDPKKPDPSGTIDRSYCPGPNFPLRDVIIACGGNPDRMS